MGLADLRGVGSIGSLSHGQPQHVSRGLGPLQPCCAGEQCWCGAVPSQPACWKQDAEPRQHCGPAPWPSAAPETWPSAEQRVSSLLLPTQTPTDLTRCFGMLPQPRGVTRNGRRAGPCWRSRCRRKVLGLEGRSANEGCGANGASWRDRGSRGALSSSGGGSLQDPAAGLLLLLLRRGALGGNAGWDWDGEPVCLRNSQARKAGSGAGLGWQRGSREGRGCWSPAFC